MRSYLTVFVVATMAVLSSLVSAQQRGPSTPEERARLAKRAGLGSQAALVLLLIAALAMSVARYL